MPLANYQLREVRKEDADRVYQWRNSDHVRPYMMNDKLIARQDHDDWFESIRNDCRKKLMICLYDEKPIGTVQFAIDQINLTCEWGFYIGEQSCPPGSGKSMGLLALDYAFEQLGVRKVCAQVLDFNARSLSYHKKLGFEEEGLLKKQIVRNGHLVDVVLFGLLREKWEESKLLMPEKE